ncbi:MAG TPA: chemotaxis protein CheW [Longimicrobiales bacterium]|nr:chemotaxis protein CheW [Longimicrobiales bacterium]
MEVETPDAAEAGIPAHAAPQRVIFVCSGACLGLALERVQEILRPRPFTRLPGSAPHTAGLIGVRGRIITAYDLGVLLGLAPAAAQADHRILLVENGSRVIGLVVDDVLAVGGLEERPGGGSVAGELALGVSAWDGRSVVVLDARRLVERLTN